MCPFDKEKYDKIKKEGNMPCEKPECDNILSWNRVHFGWHGCRSCFAMCCEEHLSSMFAKDVKMDDRKNHRVCYDCYREIDTHNKAYGDELEKLGLPRSRKKDKFTQKELELQEKYGQSWRDKQLEVN